MRVQFFSQLRDLAGAATEVGVTMPRMKRLSAVALVILLASVTILQAADHFTATWKLNLAKSTYSPGMPPRSQTTKLESVKGGIREIVDRVNADGTRKARSTAALYLLGLVS